MKPTEALDRLGKLALFPPGATIPGSSATATNVLLRAERALRGESYSNEQSLPAELGALRDNLVQRQEMLARIFNALLASPVVLRLVDPSPSEHFDETAR